MAHENHLGEDLLTEREECLADHRGLINNQPPTRPAFWTKADNMMPPMDADGLQRIEIRRSRWIVERGETLFDEEWWTVRAAALSVVIERLMRRIIPVLGLVHLFLQPGKGLAICGRPITSWRGTDNNTRCETTLSDCIWAV